MLFKRWIEWLIPGSRLSFWLHLLILGLVSLGLLHLWAWHEYRLGERLLKTHKYVEALPHLERCLLVWPESVPLKLHLARAERIVGSLQKAENYLAELRLSSQPLPEAYRIETLLLAVNQGCVDDVEPALFEYLRNNHPESPAIYETLVMLNMRVRDLSKAYYLLERWKKTDPDHPLIYELLGDCMASQGQMELAVNELEHAVELDPTAVEARISLCEIYLQLSKFTELAPHVRYLAEYARDLRPARLIMARYLLGVNRAEEAEQQLVSILDEFPEDRVAQIAMGTIYYRRNDYPHAIKYLREAYAQNPHDTQVLFMLDRCMTALDDPGLPGFRAKLAELKVKTTRLKELTEQLHKMRRQPTQEELVERGQIYLQLGDVSPAFRDLGIVLKQNPYHRGVHQILADYYTAQNNPAAASEHLKWIEAGKKRENQKSGK